MINKKILLLFIIILIIAIYLFIGSNIGKNDTFLKKYVVTYIPSSFKVFIKENFYKKKFEKVVNEANEKQLDKLKFIKELDISNQISMKKVSSSIINIASEDFKYKEFSNQILTKNGPRSYLAVSNNSLFLVTGTANLFFSDIIDSLDNENFVLKKIKTNLKDIIGKSRTEEYPAIVKDLIIDNNKIYISFIKKKETNCHFNSIVVGDLNKKQINFKSFFDMNECQSSIYLSQSGGVISTFKNNSLLYTIGDYRTASHKALNLAQDKNSLAGKIIEINKKTKKHKIISLGHRNPQGICYDKKNNVIIFSEHMARGGDELNINKLIENKIKNYGWPISSYGEHYATSIRNNKDLYLTSPLHKSHSDYGFVEPIIYFNPSIAPSEIIKINKFLDSKSNDFLLGSMGYSKENYSVGKRSFHYFKFDNNYYLINHEIIDLGERVRDIVYSEKFNKIFAFLESAGSIVIISR